MTLPPIRSQDLRAWGCILSVAALAITGECLIAAAMRGMDLDEIRARRGLLATIGTVLTNLRFVLGALCMAFNFFAMLYTLSVVALSLAAPATAALTYIGNAVAGRFFLKENVDRRRWLAASFVAFGVVLLSR